MEIVKSTYHESQKKAIKRYFNNNRESINEKARERYKKKMEDPIYREYRKNKSKEYRIKSLTPIKNEDTA
jgi:hypothetical protein